MNQLIDEIKAIRNEIRYHRDQKGDDRCWVDDVRLWTLLPDASPKPTALPPFEEMMKRCGAFYRNRRADLPDIVPPDAIQNPAEWDNDLGSMGEEILKKELDKLLQAIKLHRDISGRERTLDDDRALYRVLPEKRTADFRLPAEADFLGEARAPKAGCPSFWRSHKTCPSDHHDIHRWGPCT